MEGEGGGGIVVEGGYGGEGREEGGHNSRPNFLGAPEQLKGYCGSSGDICAKIVFVATHPTFLS